MTPMTASPLKHPSPPLVGSMAEHLGHIGKSLDGFLSDPPGDAVGRRADWTAAINRSFPAVGVGAETVIAELADVLIPNGTRLAEPGFWGWITTAPSTVPVVAATAAAVAAPQRYMITAFNLLEELSLEWLADLCGLAPTMKGVYSSGGSVANLVALGAARQYAFEQRGIDVAVDGTGALLTAVYASGETHHTIQRAAGVLGIGRANVRLVPTDDQLRMRPDALTEMLAADLAAGVVPIAVVATAGTTNTGSIDPIRASGEIARAHGVWFHVDGAYGLPGILDERVAPSYDGLELADSAIVDPHKWLNAPVGVAATFVRDRSILQRAFTQEPAAYLESVSTGDEEHVAVSLAAMGVPYADMAVELSAPSRGVIVWSILRELGREGVAARVRSDNDHARQLAQLAREHPRLELLIEPELSICCFRYRTEGVADLDALNADLMLRLHVETPYLPSSTRVKGVFALRPCFINPRTGPEMIDAFAETVVRIGDELAAARSA